MSVAKGYVRAKVGVCSMPGCVQELTARNTKGVCSYCQRLKSRRAVERIAVLNGYVPPPLERRACSGCSKTLNRGNRSGYCEKCQRAGAWKLGPFTDSSGLRLFWSSDLQHSLDQRRNSAVERLHVP
jgi:hypothetical protein